MPDTQIVSSASVAAPSLYQLPSSVEFILKAVNADFDGSGSAGSWLPAVVIASDSGHVIAYALDQAVVVAAGGSAAVSWFPGVKHAAAAAAVSADAYPIHEDMPVLSFDYNGAYFNHWNSAPTIDAAAANNAYSATDGTQNAYIAYRTMIGPQGSIHCFNFLVLTGPNYGQIWGYLASIPENDPASGAADDTNLLKDISTLSYVLVFKIACYSAALTRNVQFSVGVAAPASSYFGTTQFRVLGAPGTPFTATGYDATLGIATIDGGPGPYALKLQAVDKAGASTGYKLGIQELNRQRNDWAFA